MAATRSTENGARRLGRKDRLIQLLAVLLACSILTHVWLANLRVPTSPAVGQQINPPTRWKQTVQKHFRVSTYNIHRGKGTDGVRDLHRTAEVVRASDIVALNEVAGPSLVGSDQAKQLGKMLDAGWLFAPNQRRWYTDHFGNGLLSRFEVKRWYTEQLFYDSKKSRSRENLLVAELVLNGRPVTVLATHLDRGPIRKEQLRYVLERFKQYDFGVLLGDLNTPPDDPQLVELFADPNNVNAIKAALGDCDSPHRIDWIITRGFDVLAGSAGPPGVSDHPYFWVDIAFKESPVVSK